MVEVGLAVTKRGKMRHSFRSIAIQYLKEQEIEILDALYLASVDAPTWMTKVTKAVKPLLVSLNKERDTGQLCELLYGIINLCSPLDTQEKQRSARKNAFIHFHNAFRCPKREVVAICSLWHQICLDLD